MREQAHPRLHLYWVAGVIVQATGFTLVTLGMAVDSDTTSLAGWLIMGVAIVPQVIYLLRRRSSNEPVLPHRSRARGVSLAVLASVLLLNVVLLIYTVAT